jgi:hypothetical protein
MAKSPSYAVTVAQRVYCPRVDASREVGVGPFLRAEKLKTDFGNNCPIGQKALWRNKFLRVGYPASFRYQIPTRVARTRWYGVQLGSPRC